jgi:hypothetical protein
MVNAELLEQTMQFILDNPKKHDPKVWLEESSCGTTACFAGWACILALKTIPSWRPVAYMAADLLGLDDDDAYILFHGSNTVDQLQHYVKSLVNGEHLTPSG